MTTNENAPGEGTREQMETLARWMGWEPYIRAEADLLPSGYKVYTLGITAVELFREGHESTMWNPFTDANADYQVLERAREVWAISYTGSAFEPWGRMRALLSHACYYLVGDYARAVLAVLAQEEQA